MSFLAACRNPPTGIRGPITSDWPLLTSSLWTGPWRWGRARPGRRCTSPSAWCRRCSRSWSRRWRTGLRAVPAPGARVSVGIKYSSPHNHFTASPYCCVTVSTVWHVVGTGRCPAIRAWVVSPSGVEISADEACLTARDDHFIIGPNRGVSSSRLWCITRAGRYPAVRARAISTPSVQVIVATVKEIPAPDDHFTASPRWIVYRTAYWRVGRVSGCPTISGRIVSAACI